MIRAGRTAAALLAWSVGSSVVSGCASSYNLQPVRHAVDPRAKVQPAEGFSASGYRTFSVFPLSWISMATRLRNEGVEQQLLFDVRNQFEALGYRFVAPEQSPDFLVTVDAAVAARLPGKPQPESTLPLEMPHPAFIHPVPLASIIDFSSTLLERVHWPDDTTHAYRTGDWANWTDPRPKHPDDPTPLYPASRQARDGNESGGAVHAVVRGLMTRDEPPPAKPGGPPPPRPGAYNIPQVWVIAVDGKSFDEVWAGTAAGASPESRLELAAQLPIWAAARGFPPTTGRLADRVQSAYGFRYQIMTNDGVNYFPTVIRVGTGSPAQSAGLRAGDMIVSLGGTRLANVPLSKFSELVAGEFAGPFGVSVWRGGQEIPVFLSSPGILLNPSFRPARDYPVEDPPALGLGW